jgi:hypothetical protein
MKSNLFQVGNDRNADFSMLKITIKRTALKDTTGPLQGLLAIYMENRN